MSGRPVVGAIAGFSFGVFLWIDLILFGVLPLESGLGYLVPILGVATGLGMARWAPFGRGSTQPASGVAPPG